MMHGGDVGMIQAGLELDLAEEPLRLATGGLAPASQDFHRVLSTREGVFYPVDFTHPAAAESSDDPVGVNDGAIFKLSQRSLASLSRPHRQECDERYRRDNEHEDTGQRQLDRAPAP